MSFQPPPGNQPPEPADHPPPGPRPANYPPPAAMYPPPAYAPPGPPPPGPPLPAQAGRLRAQTRQFAFDGGAGTYFGTAVLALVITIFTLGICYPFALVLRERWRAKHSFIEGRQLVFNGSGWGLFGLWWKWFILIIITLGIYGFWVGPRIYRWKWEHTSWALQAPGAYAVAGF